MVSFANMDLSIEQTSWKGIHSLFVVLMASMTGVVILGIMEQGRSTGDRSYLMQACSDGMMRAIPYHSRGGKLVGNNTTDPSGILPKVRAWPGFTASKPPLAPSR
jgi:hypothetical protein